VKFAFKNSKLEELFLSGKGAESLPEGVYRRFLTIMQIIVTAPDERTFYQIKGLQTEKLAGNRERQFSLRLNKQYRLCFEIEKDTNGNIVFILEIVDYH
jgi:proteic killer suppression protein